MKLVIVLVLIAVVCTDATLFRKWRWGRRGNGGDRRIVIVPVAAPAPAPRNIVRTQDGRLWDTNQQCYICTSWGRCCGREEESLPRYRKNKNMPVMIYANTISNANANGGSVANSDASVSIPVNSNNNKRRWRNDEDED